MKHYLQRNLAQRLETARIATVNASTPEISAALAAAGVLGTNLQTGRTLYQAAADQVTTATARRGEQMAATETVRQCKDECRTACQALASVARGVFRDDPGALGILGLNQEMPADNSGFVLAAQTLLNYSAYTPEMAAALVSFGYTEARITQLRTKLTELQAALDAQGQAKAAHHHAKDEQRQAMRALDRWMGTFVRVARVALAEQMQMLEQLGIVARTFPTAAQRAGRVKAAATRLAKKMQKLQPVPMPQAA